MASTYTVNLGIEKIGTGEQSGTWGDTTNINFDIIDQAVNGVATVTLASPGSSGVPNLLEITNGATSDGRNKFLEFNDAADLGATAYVQLTPNDAEKVVHIRNNLSGGRSLILFQGTYNASNDFEVPNGKDVVLKFDGAGASATVTDVNADLYVTKLSFNNLKGTGATTVTNILDEDNMASDSATALATQQSIKAYVDSQVGTVDTLAEILANGNTTGGTDIAVGTGDDITFADNSKAIFGGSTELQIYYEAGASVNLIESPTYNIQVGANAIDFTSYAGTSYATIDSSGIDVTGTVTADAATLESAAPYLVLSETDQTDLNAYIGNSAGKVSIRTISDDLGTLTKRLEVDHATGDISFYDSAGSSQSLFWDASAESLGIGTSAPERLLHVKESGTIVVGLFESTSTVASRIGLMDANTTNSAKVGIGATGDTLGLYAGGSVQATVDDSGNVGIGTSTINEKLVLGSADSGSNFLQITNSTTTAANDRGFYVGIDANEAARLLNRENTDMVFGTNNSTQMTLDSSGNLGIGTTSPTGITAGITTLAISDAGAKTTGDKVGALAFITDDGSYTGTFSDGVTSEISSISETGVGGAYGLAFVTGTTGGAGRAERMRIDASGDVGIGTSSPASRLELSGVKDTSELRLSSTTNDSSWVDGEYFGKLSFYSADSSGAGAGVKGAIVTAQSGSSGATPYMTFNVASTSTNDVERMRIDANGNVGINTDNPGGKLSVRGTSGLGISDSHLAFGANQDAYITTGASGIVVFREHDGVSTNTERMRIDSSGNLLVGTTSVGYASEGIVLRERGEAYITSDGRAPLLVNRLTSDGDIVSFRKDGTTVGSIGVYVSDRLYISDNNDCGLQFDATLIRPCDSSGANNDNAIDLGSSGARFKDIYLTNTAYITAPSTSTAVLQLENLDTGVVAGQSIGNITWRANDVSAGGTGIRGRIGCEATNAGTFYALTFSTGQAATATERMRIDSSGHLLVGKATPSAATGEGHILLSDGSYYSTMAASINSTSTLNVYSTGAGTYRFYVGMGGQIYATSTSITAISDASLKENVRDLDKGLDTILALKPRRFDWKNGDGNDIMGFVAQEVQETLPELIHEVKYDNETSKLGLKMGDMIPSLVKAIQEQQEIINDLRARVAQLEGA